MHPGRPLKPGAKLGPRRELARQYRHHRIVSQLVVVIEILVAERDPKHPLTYQGQLLAQAVKTKSDLVVTVSGG